MENKKEFSHKRGAPLQAGQFPSPLSSVNSSIEKYAQKLTNSFLKDDFFLMG
ncbi:hypothetical protein HUT03_01050 [Candidatus Liberibacter africanus]|uniref:hypothetical protein n=1 Tax=Liberibacter africanus TaxID=34020 RepID=UPI001AEB316E|nr:hypothetical protein [Candidatus Liberibacter africanus]QTP63714.1 hypothetical protein HUT03_01050 [Candidatus Liberibacter africanus]